MTERELVFGLRSPEALRLAELAGFNADLGEALASLTIASVMAMSDKPPDRNLTRPLVDDAVVAYGRGCMTFGSSSSTSISEGLRAEG